MFPVSISGSPMAQPVPPPQPHSRPSGCDPVASGDATSTAIYYFTGTGNSLWIARLLASELGGARVYPMARMTKDTLASDADAVGLVFPVHSWGVPRAVLAFADALAERPGSYHFACAVNAGQVSRTLMQLEGAMKRRGMTLAGAFDIVLPSNYIPWGGPAPAVRQQELFDAASEKVRRIAGYVSRRESGLVERGPLWQRVLLSAIYRLSLDRFPKHDRNFWVDDKCNACGTCARVCPADNVVMEDGRPRWQHACEQCLACLQWCPKEAIQYGKKTPGYARYHHPDVTLADMLRSSGTPMSQTLAE